MTHSPSLQRMQAAAQAPGCLGLHPYTDNNVCFRDAIAIGRDSRERHADYAVMLGDFGDEIGPHRIRAVVEDDNDVFPVSDFPDRTDHSHPFSIVRNV